MLNTNKNKAITGFFWTSIQQFGRQGISFFVMLWLARLLDPAEFGLIGMLSIFIGISAVLATGGLTISLIRAPKVDDADYSTVFLYNFLMSIVLYVLLYFGAPFIADFFEEQQLVLITRLYCLTFLINAFSAVQISKFNREMNFKAESKAAIISSVVSGIIALIMAYYGYGVLSLVWMYIIAAAINSLLLWYQSSWRPQLRWNKERFNYHFNFGYKLALSGIIDVIFKNSYNLIIGKSYSASILGYYTRADTMKQFPVSNLSTIISKVTFPLFSKYNNNIEIQSKIYKELLKMTLFILVPLLTMLIVVAKPLIVILLTEKWLPSVPIFQILCLSGIFSALSIYTVNMINIKGKSGLFLKLEVVKKIIFATIIVISMNYGVLGLAVGQVFFSIIAYLINAFFSGILVNYSMKDQLKDLFPIFFNSILACYLVYVGLLYFHYDKLYWIDLIIAPLMIILLYLIFTWLFNKTLLLNIYDSFEYLRIMIKNRSN